MAGVRSRRLSTSRCLILLVALLVSRPCWGQAAADASCHDVLAAEPQAVSALSLDERERDGVHQFYHDVADRCAWSAAKLASLRAVLSRAADQGLDVARYHPDAIGAADGARSAPARDLFASAMALRYAHDMVFGRADLAKIEPDIDVARPADDLVGQLERALALPDIDPWLAGLAPSDPGYRRLLQAFHRYRDRPFDEAWQTMPAGPTLKLGDSGPRVAALKARLRALGDLRDGDDEPRFDAATKTALTAFQRRHGIADDGRLNRDTLAALNMPDQDRLRQMVLNLERRRYFGHVLAATRIEVNVAAATMQYIEDNRVVLAMRAVVGDRRHHSPMLVSAGLDAVVLNPTWYVPDSIVEKEIQPRLVDEPDYLERHDMHWDDGRLEQSPGAGNSLGHIKFDFPSPFAVYLHDTPSHGFFARQDRALSHGCIRLEHPQDLALKLLAGEPEWTEQRLQNAIKGSVTQKIAIAAGPQVALVYWTAFVDEDGTVEFRDDVYGRDARLEAALDATPPMTMAKDRVALLTIRHK